MIVLQISISTSKYFDTQREVSEFLGIKNSSKKAINSKVKVNGWEVDFD